jgi:fatty-acyl-CoA synthase
MTEIISQDADTIARQGTGARSATRAWLRALELTTPIAHNPTRIFPVVVEELAGRFGDAPALLSQTETLSFRALLDRSNRYARWAWVHGVGKRDAVCLLMPNRPEYVAIWTGIGRAGGVVALLNTHLVGASLAHCIDAVSPRHIIVAREIAGGFSQAQRRTFRPRPSCGRMAAARRHCPTSPRRLRNSRAVLSPPRSGRR